MGKERKLIKRGRRAYQKKKEEEMRELKDSMKIMKESQDKDNGTTDIQHVTKKHDNMERSNIKEEIEVILEQEEIEEAIESVDTTNKPYYECGSDVPSQNQSNEELWVVRKQLCRGCHSDGAFWSLQITTEGDTYAHLLETYLNIQLCPVSKDEHALSAICSLCAARLREARAFSAQARAAEERFKCMYKQKRIKVHVNEEDIKKEIPKILNEALVNEVDIKKEDPKVLKEADDSQITDDVNPDTASLNSDDTQASIEESTQMCSDKPAPQKLVQLSLSKYERVGKLFKCPFCDKLYTNKYNMRSHVKKKHLVPNEKYKTDDSQIADDVNPDTASLNSDDTQASIEESTQMCSDKPAPQKLVQLSLSEYERVGKLFKCPFCDQLYPKKYNMRIHVKKTHLVPNEKYKSKFKLSASDYERIGELYKCTRCEKQYKGIRSFRHHVMYTHLKVPRFICSHCDKTFICLTSFKKHKLDEHSIDERIKCNACDWFTYRSKAALILHKNSFHMLGEKLSCSDCDYVCFNESAIRKHVLKHTAVKEHHCKYCKKSFKRKSNLSFHERIHTGDKRKVCNVCGEAFVQRASLKYHMTKHHPEVRL